MRKKLKILTQRENFIDFDTDLQQREQLTRELRFQIALIYLCNR